MKQLNINLVKNSTYTLNEIFDIYKELALLSKYGGGLGVDWTKIRSLNSYIDVFAGAGGGVIPFLKITNDVAIAVDQTGRLCPHIQKYILQYFLKCWKFLKLITLQRNQ